MKRLMTILTAVAVALVLAACASAEKTAMPTNGNPTVENLFTQPISEEPAFTGTTSGEENVTEAAETLPGGSVGSLTIGPKESLMDQVGPYQIYSGGEYHIPYEVFITGTVAEHGVGVLIFLDGKPQPYKIGETGEYQYLHTVYPKASESYTIDIYFTPVTGQVGEMPELYVLALLNPGYRPSNKESMGLAFTVSAVYSATRLEMDETPPAMENTAATWGKKNSCAVTYEDTKFSEVGDWSDTDFQEKIETHLSVNGVPDGGMTLVHGVTKDTPVTLHYEAWGTPYVEFGLVVFVNNQPVLYDDLSAVDITLENGKKTVVEATLDMSGFEEEGVVYAVLVPKNFRTSSVMTTAGLTCSATFYLLSDTE